MEQEDSLAWIWFCTIPTIAVIGWMVYTIRRKRKKLEFDPHCRNDAVLRHQKEYNLEKIKLKFAEP